jgi:hypothetical protein
MLLRIATMALLLCCGLPADAQNEKPFDAAAAFGARQSVVHLALSPDGTRVVYVSPSAGQGSVVYTREFGKDAAARAQMLGKSDTFLRQSMPAAAAASGQ